MKSVIDANDYVIDAVIDHRGAWPDNTSLIFLSYYEFAKTGKISMYDCGAGSITESDFNQCIQELSTNFGRSVTYDEYKATYYKYKECYSRCIQIEIKTKESNMKLTKDDIGKEFEAECGRVYEVALIKKDSVALWQATEEEFYICNLDGVIDEGFGKLVKRHEPLQDGAAYQFDYGHTVDITGLYSKSDIQFRAIIGYFNSDYCTNIIKLIPEVK